MKMTELQKKRQCRKNKHKVEEKEPWKTLNEWAKLFDVLENGFE